MSKSFKLKAPVIIAESTPEGIQKAFAFHFSEITKIVEQLQLKYINVTTTIEQMSDKQVQMHIDIDELRKP